MALTIGFVGLGTVNSGVVALCKEPESQAHLQSRGVGEINIKAAMVADLKKERSAVLKDIELTDKLEDIINDPQINVVVISTGVPELDLKAIEDAIKAGKHVITSNKDIIARHGTRLFTLAKEKKVSFGIEACCMGGNPIISILQDQPSAVSELMGVVNGTTNYLLEQLLEKPFAVALNEAIEKGIAEPDPSADISGKDSVDKAVILTALAFNTSMEAVHALLTPTKRGIENLSSTYIQELAEEFYGSVKLIYKAKRVNNTVHVSVWPTAISKDHFLASLPGCKNGIVLTTNTGDQYKLNGPGAGTHPTGSAVMRDLVKIATNTMPTFPQQGKTKVVVEKNHVHYLRFKTASTISIPYCSAYRKTGNDYFILIKEGKLYTELLEQLQKNQIECFDLQVDSSFVNTMLCNLKAKCHYNYAGRTHFFAAAAEGYKETGDALKSRLLRQFIQQLDNAKNQSSDDLTITYENIKQSKIYKEVLAKGQGFTTRLLGLQTDSCKALQRIYEEMQQSAQAQLGASSIDL